MIVESGYVQQYVVTYDSFLTRRNETQLIPLIPAAPATLVTLVVAALVSIQIFAVLIPVVAIITSLCWMFSTILGMVTEDIQRISSLGCKVCGPKNQRFQSCQPGSMAPHRIWQTERRKKLLQEHLSKKSVRKCLPCYAQMIQMDTTQSRESRPQGCVYNQCKSWTRRVLQPCSLDCTHHRASDPATDPNRRHRSKGQRGWTRTGCKTSLQDIESGRRDRERESQSPASFSKPVTYLN